MSFPCTPQIPVHSEIKLDLLEGAGFARLLTGEPHATVLLSEVRDFGKGVSPSPDVVDHMALQLVFEAGFETSRTGAREDETSPRGS